MVMTKGSVAHDTVPYFMERFRDAYTVQLENFARERAARSPAADHDRRWRGVAAGGDCGDAGARERAAGRRGVDWCAGDGMSKASPLLHSRTPRGGGSGALITVTPASAGWQFVSFAVRRIGRGEEWTGRTGGDEVCLVLLEGEASVSWSPGPSKTVRLGPRRDVFSDYPHALYLPPGTRFELRARRTTEIGLCGSPTDTELPRAGDSSR